jgi:UDP-glucuronate 4-epimerase
MTYLITGAAGFIGFHTAARLLEQGEKVIGIDSLNDYYSVELKKARLEQLSDQQGFEFHQVDIAEASQISQALGQKKSATLSISQPRLACVIQ